MAAKVVCRCGWTGGPYGSPARAEAMAAKHGCRTEDGVRRATRRYRCARCGLEQTYENAGATEARYWFGRHSCQKREMAMLRSAMAEQREALIDRTPKPCLHKRANHQHGEYACYVLDRCRCRPCADANSEYERNLNRLKAYGRYHKYVNAEHVRAHLAELRAYGIGLKRVSEISGVSNGSLTKIWYGLYPTTGSGGGRNGAGVLVRGPARRVQRKTAEAIFAVEPVPANLGGGSPDPERTPAARLQLRALVALGWSMSKLGRRLGMQHVRNLTLAIHGPRVMQRRTVDAVEALYAELSMALPPEATKNERISASRSRNYAKSHGWLPPLDLEVVKPERYIQLSAQEGRAS